MELTPRLYTGADLIDGELHPLALGLVAIYSAKAPDSGDGDVNEDSCALIPFNEMSGILVVADGAGGQPSGARASAIAVGALRDALAAAAKSSGELRGAILDGIETANHEVIALGVGAGTTLAVAEINGAKARTYHVGDSQILVVGQRGKIKLLTMCHSPVGYAVGAGLLAEHEAIMHAERHLVSNLVGSPTMHIEIGPVIELSPKDTVIVASDGLFDNLHVEEIAETCRKGPLLEMTRKLAERCHGRMQEVGENQPSKPDDLTFAMYRRREVE